jgi:signal transduction histidine kinase
VAEAPHPGVRIQLHLLAFEVRSACSAQAPGVGVSTVTRRPGASAEVSGLASRLPSLLVVTVLMALLIVPILVQRRVDHLRVEIEEVAEPAQSLLAEAQYLLARQSSALVGFLVTGTRGYLDEFTAFSDRERAIYAELIGYAGDLGPEPLAHVVEMRTLSEHWHERVQSDDVRAPGDASEPLEVWLEQDLYLRTLAAAGRASQAIGAEMMARRWEIRRVERIAALTTFLLLFLALAAAVGVLNLTQRIRRLAAESDARRREVEVALEETARAAEARTSLIRGFTHDVKNPLGAAAGHAQLLENGVRGELSDAQAKAVGRIRASIGQALEIIDHLLEISKLETGGLRTRRDPVEVHALVKEVVQHYAGSTDGVELRLAEPARDRQVVYTDAARVRQVLENLVSNALKYTPAPGSVRVSFEATPDDPPPRPGAWLPIAVSDTGPGIPAEELERIFNEFHRVPGTPGGGHGLGLAISRRIARLLGGEVTVRSTLGAGSTFVLWLPVREEH